MTGMRRDDTAGSHTRRLGIAGCRILCELASGIPLGSALGRAPPLPVVFKSGSFGRGDFLRQALLRIAKLTHHDPSSPC